MWTCPKCGREFKNQNQDHCCGEAPKTIDEYIAGQSEQCQPYLNEVRDAIRAALPEAENAKLLEETNMTFMKGSTGRNAALVDEILLELGRNRTLAEEITEFTTSNSTFIERANTGVVLTLGDSEHYRESGRLANVRVGNTQFPWPFQVAVAEQTARWLSGALDMDGLLAFMAGYSSK